MLWVQALRNLVPSTICRGNASRCKALQGLLRAILKLLLDDVARARENLQLANEAFLVVMKDSASGGYDVAPTRAAFNTEIERSPIRAARALIVWAQIALSKKARMAPWHYNANVNGATPLLFNQSLVSERENRRDAPVGRSTTATVFGQSILPRT